MGGRNTVELIELMENLKKKDSFKNTQRIH